MLRHIAVICANELRLLTRNRSAAGLALGVPLVFGGYLALEQPDFFGLEATAVWPVVVTMQVVIMLGFTVYITTTSMFAARRQDLFLKRLRSGESSDATIIVGLALPTLVLVVVQLSVLGVLTGLAGAPFPAAPMLLGLAVVGGAAMCCAAGVLTSCFTQSAEQAQFTTTPFFFALLAGGMVVLQAGGQPSLWQLAIPGGAVAELVLMAWQADTAFPADALPLIGIVVAWTVVPVMVASRVFRWAPRP